MPYRLVCVDLDGTMLNKEHQLDPKTIEAIRRADARGIKVVISTGRIYEDARFFWKQLGIQTPILASSGAIVMDPVNEKILYMETFGEELLKKVWKLLSEEGIKPFLHTPTWMYCGLKAKIFLTLGKTMGYFKHQIDSKTLLNHRTWVKTMASESERIIKCEVIDQNVEKVQKVRKKLETIEGIEINGSSGRIIEMTRKGVSKGKAVAFLSAYFNIPQSEIICIGDSQNDLSMLRYAGLGVAMENGTEEAKAAANVVTLSNIELGVAKVLETYCSETV